MYPHILLAALLPLILPPAAKAAPVEQSGESPKKLGDAFNVWGIDTKAVGEKVLDPKAADSCAPYYDHSKALGAAGGKVLNDHWNQIVDMNQAALSALEPGNYDDSQTSRNHVKSFFGMLPWVTEAGTEMAPPRPTKKGRTKVVKTERDEENRRSREFYDHIKLWYDTVDGYIRRRPVKGSSWAAQVAKPILACGSHFAQLQKPTSLYHDWNTGKVTEQKLQDVPVFQDPFKEDKLIFWLDAPFQTYVTFDKRLFPGADQWPKDKDGNQHFCNSPNSDKQALSFSSKFKGDGQRFKLIVLCPQLLGPGSEGLTMPALTAQPKDKSLDEMATESLELYREMFRLFEGEELVPGQEAETGDAQVMVADSKFRWPGLKQSWKSASTPEKLVSARTGIDALWLTVWDRVAEVIVESGKAEKIPVAIVGAPNSPSNYAWFGLVSLMTSKSKQDWSTGKPRPADSPWQLVWAKSKNAPGPLFTEAELRDRSMRRMKEAHGSILGAAEGSHPLPADAPDLNTAAKAPLGTKPPAALEPAKVSPVGALLDTSGVEGQRILPQRPANDPVAGPSRQKSDKDSKAASAGGKQDSKSSEFGSKKDPKPPSAGGKPGATGSSSGKGAGRSSR